MLSEPIGCIKNPHSCPKIILSSQRQVSSSSVAEPTTKSAEINKDKAGANYGQLIQQIKAIQV